MCDTQAVEERPEEEMRVTYLMLNNRNGYIKIGVSNNPSYREKTLQSEEPEIILIATAPDADLERALHREYADYRIRGEWFLLRPENMQRIIGCGFEPVAGREEFFSAFSSGLDYDGWMTEKLIRECELRLSDREDNLEMLRRGLDPVHDADLLDCSVYQEDVERLIEFIDTWIEEGDQQTRLTLGMGE
jgi:hypothetical protein